MDPQVTQPVPTASPTDQSPPPVAPRPRTLSVGDVAGDLLMAFFLGGFFLIFGMRFIRYLLAGGQFDTKTNWGTGPAAGQPIGYWDLGPGVAWGEMGFAVLGLLLIVGGGLIMLGVAMPQLRRKLATLAAVLAAIGAAANLLAVIMLVKIDIQPIISMLAILAGGVTAFSFARHAKA